MTTGDVILAAEVMNLAVSFCCWMGLLRRGERDEEGMILGSEAGFMILANIVRRGVCLKCGVCVCVCVGGVEKGTGGVEKYGSFEEEKKFRSTLASQSYH